MGFPARCHALFLRALVIIKAFQLKNDEISNTDSERAFAERDEPRQGNRITGHNQPECRVHKPREVHVRLVELVQYDAVLLDVLIVYGSVIH